MENNVDASYVSILMQAWRAEAARAPVEVMVVMAAWQ
ncbi:hypothetical protein HNR34_003074 [Geobacillus subterraneus]